MSYRLLIDPRADRQLESLPKTVVQRIDKAILTLAGNARPPGTRQVGGDFSDPLRTHVGAKGSGNMQIEMNACYSMGLRASEGTYSGRHDRFPGSW